MSSSAISTEGFVPGRKLVVHVAENGHSFEFECDGSTLVETLQRSIESLSGVQLCDQLLLCLDKKLESNRPLSSYKLPQDDSEAFLFCRPRLHADSPPPHPETITLHGTVEPDPPSPYKNTHVLDDAPDPALKALPSYERQFRYHFQRGHALFTATQDKFDVCQRLLREQKIQQRALDTARGSMDQGYGVVQQNFTEFIKCYSQQHRYHSDILANLPVDIEKLRSCQLHPALLTGTRKCLLDLVKEDNLRKWAESCANTHRQFEGKVAQFKLMFGELKKKVEDLGSDYAASAVRNTDFEITDHRKCLDEQKSIMQSLSKDVNTVKKLVDDCLSCQLSDSLRPHDAVSALGPMYDVHEKNHLPKMQGCDTSVTKLFDSCIAKKNEMNLFVHQFMQKVVYVQFIIRDIRLQFPAFKEAMERQDEFFSDLKVVRGIAPAYRACFAEIIRRKSSMKLYMGLAGQLAERLATEREVEVRKREEFLDAQSVYVPRDILASMGLFDSPKHCDVNIAPFDTNLLEIDFADLDRFAPKHLAGVPLKWIPKNGSTSTCSYDLSEGGMNSSVSNDNKYDSEEILKACESVTIVGTSKLEVENAWLKAELASAVAMICSLNPEIGLESVNDTKLDSVLKSTAEKTAEALNLKDEYNKHILSMLKSKKMQCSSYGKRIQQLEQRLSNNYLQSQKLLLSDDKDPSDSEKRFWKSRVSGDGDGDGGLPDLSIDPMDEASCTSATMETKLEHSVNGSSSLSKPREGVDENMTDLLCTAGVNFTQNSTDSLMTETNREQRISDIDTEDKMTTEFGLTSFIRHEVAEDITGISVSEHHTNSQNKEDLVSELQNALSEKSINCEETETKFNNAIDEVNSLRKDLDASRRLLDESLMNCAHLENCLHEAREQAHTNLCAADRKASEFTALRTSSVKMHDLFDRFRTCVNSSSGVSTFVESLRTLAHSLASSPTTEGKDGITEEFKKSIILLAEKVNFLSRHRSDLLDRCSKSEGAHTQLVKEVEEKKELVKHLYIKLQIEKQASKDKISLSHLEVHELAAFVLNSYGQYEAINHRSGNYYLSSESVALFTEQSPTRSPPAYVIGQVVHIDRQVVKHPVDRANLTIGKKPSSSSSLLNPYNLPVGCQYFIVTVAMVPNNTTICSSLSFSSS